MSWRQKQCLKERFREDMPYYLDDLVSNDGWKEPYRGRLDLRGLQTVTIDGEDARIWTMR